MAAMRMAFEVRDRGALAGIEPGMMVEFTLVVTSDATYAEAIRIGRTRPSSRIRSLHEGCACWSSATQPLRLSAPPALAVGQAVPDFPVDQPEAPAPRDPVAVPGQGGRDQLL